MFDAESRITSGAGVSFVYNGDGERVQKSDGTTYWGGGAGSALLETDNSGNPKAEYIFFNGKRLARRDLPGGSVKLYFADNLGSASVISDTSGNLLESYDYAPYGELHATSGSDSNHYLFGGKERDSETGLDYFGARYYGNALGRWMSPDWAAKPTSVPYASFGDPQTLNLYAYVANRPIIHMDADGHVGPIQPDPWSVDAYNITHTQAASEVNDGGPTAARSTQADNAAVSHAAATGQAQQTKPAASVTIEGGVGYEAKGTNGKIGGNVHGEVQLSSDGKTKISAKAEVEANVGPIKLGGYQVEKVTRNEQGNSEPMTHGPTEPAVAVKNSEVSGGNGEIKLGLSFYSGGGGGVSVTIRPQVIMNNIVTWLKGGVGIPGTDFRDNQHGMGAWQ